MDKFKHYPTSPGIQNSEGAVFPPILEIYIFFTGVDDEFTDTAVLAVSRCVVCTYRFRRRMFEDLLLTIITHAVVIRLLLKSRRPPSLEQGFLR